LTSANCTRAEYRESSLRSLRISSQHSLRDVPMSPQLLHANLHFLMTLDRCLALFRSSKKMSKCETKSRIWKRPVRFASHHATSSRLRFPNICLYSANPTSFQIRSSSASGLDERSLRRLSASTRMGATQRTARRAPRCRLRPWRGSDALRASESSRLPDSPRGARARLRPPSCPIAASRRCPPLRATSPTWPTSHPR
jgi:hypothetical protein